MSKRRHLGTEDGGGASPRMVPPAPVVRDAVREAVRPLMGAGRADRNPTDIYPQGDRGIDEKQSLIFDAIVDTLRLIPGLDADWALFEGMTIIETAPVYPYVWVIRQSSVVAEETNTSYIVRVTANLRVYVAGEDNTSRSLTSLRIENEMSNAFNKKSIGGMTCAPRNLIGRSVAQRPTGGQQNIRMTNNMLNFEYIKKNDV
jgi:hypothetical protein